jgi:hypothetical protein
MANAAYFANITMHHAPAAEPGASLNVVCRLTHIDGCAGLRTISCSLNQLFNWLGLLMGRAEHHGLQVASCDYLCCHRTTTPQPFTTDYWWYLTEANTVLTTCSGAVPAAMQV